MRTLLEGMAWTLVACLAIGDADIFQTFLYVSQTLTLLVDGKDKED